MATEEDKDLEVDHLEDHQEEEDCLEVEDHQGTPNAHATSTTTRRTSWRQVGGQSTHHFHRRLLQGRAIHYQWQLYEGVNITNMLMHNPYQRAMFFLTYIQGNLVNEWVKGVNAWLCTQVTTQGWATTDEHLWNGVIGAFNRQYADVLEQEKAQAELGRGLCMQNGDLDGLITRFEQLVCHANYDVNQPLVL
jgi:hypothetical protein